MCRLEVHVGATCAEFVSRLHHDYHDTLYILLRGSVRFRLFPPTMAHRMYTHGQIRTVHPNGRIVYEGQVRPSPCWHTCSVRVICIHALPH